MQARERFDRKRADGAFETHSFRRNVSPSGETKETTRIRTYVSGGKVERNGREKVQVWIRENRGCKSRGNAKTRIGRGRDRFRGGAADRPTSLFLSPFFRTGATNEKRRKHDDEESERTRMRPKRLHLGESPNLGPVS